MEVHLIRHPKPNIAKGVCYGQADIELEKGWEDDVLKINNAISDVEVFYSSPLKRCRQLAEKIGKNIQYDDRLMELNFGEWEQRAWDDIDPISLEKWMKDYLNEAPPGGESANELYNRVGDFLENLKAQNHKKVVIVAHLGVFRAIYSYLENVSLNEAFSQFELSFGEITIHYF